MTNQEWNEWVAWFNACDLGKLEDVRWYVEQHALENVCDVPNSGVLECAKQTVMGYIDDPCCAEVFNYYRKFCRNT